MKQTSLGTRLSSSADFTFDLDLDLDFGLAEPDREACGVDRQTGPADGVDREPQFVLGGWDRLETSNLPNPTRGPRDAIGGTTRAAIFADLLAHEGNVPHMYRDTRGFVTTGIGHLLKTPADAQKLPWIDAASGRPATRQQIDAEFERVAGMKPAMRASKYHSESGLVLPKATAAELANRRLDDEFLPALRRLCPDFDSFPPQAQRALVDMAYNLGTGKIGKFHHLLADCNRQDWAAAAEHCHRKVKADGHGEERNAWTRDLFLQADAQSAIGLAVSR